MPEVEVAPTLDNSDIPFEDALKRTLFDKQLVPIEIDTFGRFEGDYGQYWKLKGKLAAPATDIDNNVHHAGSAITLMLNVPGKDASEGQWKAYNARLAELQIHAMGLPKPDQTANMKLVEGKTVVAKLSVYTNPTTGNAKQQVDRFLAVTKGA